MKRVNCLKFLDRKILASGGIPTVRDQLQKQLLYKEDLTKEDMLNVKQEFAFGLLSKSMNIDSEQKKDLN